MIVIYQYLYAPAPIVSTEVHGGKPRSGFLSINFHIEHSIYLLSFMF